MGAADDPIVPIATQQEWEAWLEAEHDTADGVWLKLAKKPSGLPAPTWDACVDTALCFGWIDGQSKSIDDTYFKQRYTPRRPRSRWSKINRDRVERLIAEGRMRPKGLEEVERAKADGRWDAAYDSPKTATVPDDLQQALDENPEAKAFFATLKSRNRYAILHRIQEAKKPETRARRIAKYVAMCAAGETLYP